MLKCPFCGFDNEDGALFCEQCKSDLSMVPTTPAAPPPAVPAAHHAEAVPMAAIMEEDTIPMAAPMLEADVVPMADPIEMEAVPMAAEMIEPIPMAPPAPPPPPPPPVVPEPSPMAAAVGAVPVPPTPVAADSPPPAAHQPPIPPPAPTPVVAAAPAPSAAAPTADGGKLPAGTQPKLVVVRGQKVNFEFPIYEGMNFIGRADEKPVDIDLEDQEPPDRVWCSRQHALITFDDGALSIEDLNSANGTYVNRARVYPGKKQSLSLNDVVQIGTVHMKVKG